jgi:hypothetical protein
VHILAADIAIILGEMWLESRQFALSFRGNWNIVAFSVHFHSRPHFDDFKQEKAKL